jgi:uncharacterized cupin superfamily protein
MPIVPPEAMLREEEDAPGGTIISHWISQAGGDSGGLSQFGALIQTIPPGTSTSHDHWHANEDEMVLLLDGWLLLHEGDVATRMKPGDAAVFPAGVAVGHHLENAGDAPARLLVVGTRAATDIITYTADGRRCVRVRALPDDLWIDRDGKPV